MRDILMRRVASGIRTTYMRSGKWVTAANVRRCTCGAVATCEFYQQKQVSFHKIKRVVLVVVCDKHRASTATRLKKRRQA